MNNIIEDMNYHFLNPEKDIEVDTKIAQAFVYRERENVDSFESWADLSRERENIMPLISAYKQEINYTKEEGFAKAA